MTKMTHAEQFHHRAAPIEMEPEHFRALGHQLTDQIAAFLTTLPERAIVPARQPAVGEEGFDLASELPTEGTDAADLLERATRLLFDFGVFQHHPRWASWITGAASPIGTLAEYLAAAVNQGVAAADGVAGNIEAQTIRWIAELIGYPTDCGGLFLSGGNLANITAFHAARTAQADWDIRADGLMAGNRQLYAYGSRFMHSWIEKAADMSGIGTKAIRWIDTDAQFRIDPDALRTRMQEDIVQGGQPFIVIGTAGTTEIGAIDPLHELAAIAREFGCWFHVDAAYGGVAAILPDAPDDLKGLSLADSIVVDPHKWLYAPKGAGCVLVREPRRLFDAFAFRPPYFHGMSTEQFNYFEMGPETTRGFRALKVWLALQQVGRDGYAQMVAEDMRLSRALHDLAVAHPELQAMTQNLSIATFRYIPLTLVGHANESVGEYLNVLNAAIMKAVNASGEAVISNAIIDGVFALRTCIVNFRTSLSDVEAIIDLAVRCGREQDSTMRPQELRDAR